MKFLNLQKHCFTDEQAHWFYRYIGVNALNEKRFRDFLKAYKDAEAHDPYGKLVDDGFYFNITHCLTQMGYAVNAIEYLDKSQSLAIAKSDDASSNDARTFRAINYMRVGRKEEALQLALNCLKYEEKIKDNRIQIGRAHQLIARAYSAMGKYKEAIKSFDTALTYVNKSNNSTANFLYYKAATLFESGDRLRALEVINEGLTLVNQDTPMHTLLYSSLCIYNLPKTDLLNDLTDKILPKLKKYEVNLQVIRCYEALGNHFESKSNHKKAAEYYKSANDLNKKLREGDVTP